MGAETPLVVGVDAGGSYTRALVASIDGDRVQQGRGGGANPYSRGLDQMAASLTTALRSALSAASTARVQRGVVAIAGGEAVGADTMRARIGAVWREARLTCPCDVVSDVEAAFAAGSRAREGVVLVSGTGAVAGLVRGGRLVRRVDGYGWLLGDDGSGFWLGREAVRATLGALDGRGRPTRLVGEVTRALHAPADPRALVARINERPPLALAELAPLVSEAAAAGDKVAGLIVERAAECLLAAVDALGPTSPHEAVLAGGALASTGPLADLVREGMRSRWRLSPVAATDGAAGAAALAIRACGEAPLTAEVHARLTGR